MVEYNRCQWLTVGSTENCNKRCINKFCGRHRGQLRKKPDSEPHRCRRCLKGTQSETRLCSKKCGSDRAQKALHRAEARARRKFPIVMNELVLLANLQKKSYFIGL